MSKIKQKSNNLWLLIAALILATIIFLFGLLLGNYIAMAQLEEFKQTEERFLVDLIALEIRDSVLEQDICNLNIADLFEEKAALGKMLTELEKRLGKENEEVMAKKEIYELIEIKTLQQLEKIKQECGQEFNIVLFFYTNKKADPKGSVDGCEDQGKILDQVVYEHNEQNKGKPVYVFSFDVNSKNQATKALLLKYNITSVPTLIINAESHGYLVKAELEEIL
ncbi:MAG: hypothetical protein N3G19_00590 [Candidatus Pacearchaeota archaeon]|nr:hypothetical protein [Candidatus Pacearchaeota archaeon]